MPGWSGLWNLCTGYWMSISARTFAASKIKMCSKILISSENSPCLLSNHLKRQLLPSVPTPTSCSTAFLSLTPLFLFGLKIDFRAHFPPGTSKWNKVEHRLFCFITKNWQGQPLVDVQTAVNLIGSTTTSAGLKVVCKADYNDYPLSKRGSDEEYRSIQIDKINPFGDWNYIIG